MNFDKKDLAKLEAAYDKAVEDKQKTFMFDENELVLDYAKYLIEYLTIELKDK